MYHFKVSVRLGSALPADADESGLQFESSGAARDLDPLMRVRVGCSLKVAARREPEIR